MANFKRSKPRKQTRHPISNYGRGFNKNKVVEEPHTGLGKGVAKKKPIKPYGIKESTTYGPYIMKLFPHWKNPSVRFYWYVTKKARDTALERYQNRRGRNDHENIVYTTCER